jgi:hypothetical protein
MTATALHALVYTHIRNQGHALAGHAIAPGGAVPLHAVGTAQAQDDPRRLASKRILVGLSCVALGARFATPAVPALRK